MKILKENSESAIFDNEIRKWVFLDVCCSYHFWGSKREQRLKIIFRKDTRNLDVTEIKFLNRWKIFLDNFIENANYFQQFYFLYKVYLIKFSCIYQKLNYKLYANVFYISDPFLQKEKLFQESLLSPLNGVECENNISIVIRFSKIK